MQSAIVVPTTFRCPIVACPHKKALGWPGQRVHLTSTHLADGTATQEDLALIAAMAATHGLTLCVCGRNFAAKSGTCPTCATRARCAANLATAETEAHRQQRELRAPADAGPLLLPSLESVFARQVNTTAHIPKRCRPRMARLLRKELSDAAFNNDLGAWTRLVLICKCLLGPRLRGGKHEHRQLDATIERRMDRWEDGDLLGLWAEVTAKAPPATAPTQQQAVIGAFRLVREGHYSRAFARLTSGGVQQATPEVLATLRRLHPAAPPPQHPREQQPSRAPEITTEMVVQALASFDPLTAPGAMGLKVPHLTDLIASDPSGSFAAALTRLIQRLADGTVCGEVRPFICGACLTALPKPDGGTRPIAAGEILRRLTSKVLIGAVRTRLDAHFLPHQFGVGSRGGGERVIHHVRALIGASYNCPDFVLLKVDLQNAFNRVDRTAVMAAVAEDFPSLLPWVACLYGAPSVLWFGQEKISSQCGVQQGDPLGPLLFSLALHAIVKKIAAIPHLEACLWYLDDGVIAGKHRAVHQARLILEREGPPLGLHLNTGKCELVWLNSIPATHGFDDSFAPPPKRHLNNFELLGAPLGDAPHTTAFVERTVLVKARAAWDVLRLADGDTQVVYSLLRQCCSANRIGHLLRSVPPSLLEETTGRFDSEFRAAFTKLLHVGLDHSQWDQASLPTRLGGLGLTSAAAHRAPAYVASVAFACATDFWSRTRAPEFYSSVTHLLDVCCADPVPAGMNPLAHLSATVKAAKPVQPSQRELSALIHSATTHRLHATLSQYHIARLNAVSETGAGCWLNVVPSLVLRLAIHSAEFSTLIRWWLGAELFVARQTCPFCGVNMDAEGQHALVCRNGGHFGVRHHALRDTFFHAMRSACMNPRLEVPNLLEGSSERPADVMWDNICGDVCVTHPLQPKYLALTATRVAGDDGAAQEKYGTDVKLRKYAVRCAAAGLEIHPLVASAYGAWGVKGRALIDTIAKRVSARTSVPAGVCATQLHQRLSVTLLRSNAKAILSRTAAAAPNIFLDALDDENPEVFDPSVEATNFFDVASPATQAPPQPPVPRRSTSTAAPTQPSTVHVSTSSAISRQTIVLPCASNTIQSIASADECQEEMYDCEDDECADDDEQQEMIDE